MEDKNMANIYYQEDCNLSLLEDKTIAIVGYGSQGHAHALNLKESGCNVIIGLYEGSKSWAKAQAQGFEVYTAAEAAKKADIIMILINDEKQAELYKKDIVLFFGESFVNQKNACFHAAIRIKYTCRKRNNGVKKIIIN